MELSNQDLDEDEALAFLQQSGTKRRTWAENKQLKAARKKDRRHFDDKSQRPDKPPNQRRLPISELKRITRCSNCGEKGHWKEDCVKPYRSRASREKVEKGAQGSAFVFLGVNEALSNGSWWISSVLAENSSEVFLSLPPGHAIIDPGASQDLIGIDSYKRLEKCLRENGLKPVRLSESPLPASGIGGEAKPLFCSLVPSVLGGKPGVIKLTVVSQDIPQLLSVGLLEHAGAIIDVANNRIQFSRLDSSAKLHKLSSGHRTLDVASWDGSKFPVPAPLREQFKLKADAFSADDSEAPRVYAAAVESPCKLLSFQLLFGLTGDNHHEETPLGTVNRVELQGNQCRLGQFCSNMCQEPLMYRTSWIVSRSHENTSHNMPVQLLLLEAAHDLSISPNDRVVSSNDCLGREFNSSDQLIQLFSREAVIVSDHINPVHFARTAAASSQAQRIPSDFEPLTSQHGCSQTHVREPQREGRLPLVRVDSSTSHPEAGAGELVADAGPSLGLSRAVTEARCLCSSRELLDSRGESAWGMEEVFHVRQEDELREVGTSEPPSRVQIRLQDEEEERDVADNCQHGKPCGDELCVADSDSYRVHHGGRGPVDCGAAINLHGPVDSLLDVSGNDADDGGHAADGGDSGPVATNCATAADDVEPHVGRSGESTSGDASSGIDRHCIGPGREHGRLDGCQDPLRAAFFSFTKETVSELGLNCTEDPSKFIGRLSMPVVNYLLNGDESGYWGIGDGCGEPLVIFHNSRLSDQLSFGDWKEGKEFQVTRKTKSKIRSSASSLLLQEIDCKPSTELFSAFCRDVNSMFGQTTLANSRSLTEDAPASRADKAKTARKDPNGDDATASPAAKARTARKGPIGDDATASRAAKARTAKVNQTASDVDARTTPEDLTAAVSTPSPYGLRFSHLSPHGLRSVATRASAMDDPQLKRFRVARNDVSSYRILELFSPPRVSTAAKKAGFSLTEPSNFDIKVGWDFFDASDRAEFWRVVEEQRPDCILMTPECRPFSTMMDSNWGRMNAEDRERMQTEGLAMFHFCIQVAEYQLRHGREFSLEHPGFANSRQTHAMLWLLKQDGVIRFLFDQCMTGLRVVDEALSRKTTALVTNHLGLAAVFSSLQCSKDHAHVRLENGLPIKASVFGDELIAKFIQGLSFEAESAFFGDEDFEDLEASLDAEVEASGQGHSGRRAAPSTPVGVPMPRTPSVNMQNKLTAEQKKKVNQVHANLGHISKQQMLALFKAAGAKDSVMRFIRDEFSCEQCSKQKRPIDRKKASMPRTFAFNRQVAVDVFYISWGNRTHAFLNVICLGTNFQQIQWLRPFEGGSPSSRVTWLAFQQCWLKPFGSPELLLSDGGGEFKDHFERSLEQHNIMQVISDAASPWQNAKVERHGGWLKERAEQELMSGLGLVTSSEELDELLSSLVMHKNRWFSRGGFSPSQLVFGTNPQLPTDLLADDPQELGWQDVDMDPFDQDTAAAQFARSHRIRQRARELCIQHNSENKIRLASKGKIYKQRQWALGQWVFVWRKHPGSGQGHVTRSRWVGPGIVVLQAGHTVYVSMRSRLWKCNSEQLRPASHHESIGAALAQTHELQDILAQTRANRCGAVDVASEGTPDERAQLEPSPDPAQRPVVVSPDQVLPTISEESELQLAPPGVGVGHALRRLEDSGTDLRPHGPVEPESNGSEASDRRSREEPLAEPVPEAKRLRTTTSESVPSSSASSSNPSRVRRQVDAIEDVEARRLQREALKELRRLNREEKLTRVVAPKSAAAQVPSDVLRPLREALQSDDTASAGIDPSLPPEAEDESLALDSRGNIEHLVFANLEPCSSEDQLTLMTKVIKPRSSEFSMKDATADDVKGFAKSDEQEWNTICGLGAVKVLSPSEASDIRKSKPHRILASRMVRRKKPTPGIGNFKYKSRWCVLGHGDPDSGTFKTFAPMPSTECISLFFQLALCLDLVMLFADVKSAFCQGDPLDRPQGELFAEACAGLGLPTGSLIQLIAPVYGLDDAPIRWHQTVVQYLFSLGFERSLFEACWLTLKKEGRIVAMIMLEVDDFNIAVLPSYQATLQESLQQRFEFGKWESGSADFAGRSVQFHSDRVTMSQVKYIAEKLHQVKIPKGMLSQKDALLDQDLFEEYRSMLYRVSWLAHQTRPEATGIVSLLSSRMNRATIHDLNCLNKLVHHIKSTASQPLVLHKFDLDKLVLIAASDAGGVASEPVRAEDKFQELEDTVQGAWVILASDRMPSASQRVKVSVLSWRSSKLRRRVSSTLASEALAFNQALAEVEWIQLIIRDIIHGDVHRDDWRKSVVPFVAVLKEECELKSRLQQCCVTDAKSLFDAIVKETSCSRQDRRTAIELAIILEALRRSGSVVRWSPHPRMIADVLTKDNIAKSNGAFEEVLRTSKMSIWDEQEELNLRKANPSMKLRSKKAAERLRSEGSTMLSLLSLVNINSRELLHMFHHLSPDAGVLD